MADLISTGALIGFGSSSPSIDILGTTIDLTDSQGLLYYAFTLPREATVTAITAFYSLTVQATLLTPVSVVATVFSAPPGSNIFSETDISITLAPPIPAGATLIGASRSGIETGLSETFPTGTRLLMVFSLATDFSILSAVTGFASASLAIN
ncbi:hypothetical protein M3936_15825 [Sutcliffiella horikoshii]|nr:hypothetical protein [Sutcliffiella horikoshii]